MHTSKVFRESDSNLYGTDVDKKNLRKQSHRVAIMFLSRIQVDNGKSINIEKSVNTGINHNYSMRSDSVCIW